MTRAWVLVLLLGFFDSLFAPLPVFAAPTAAQLNIQGFASCLAQEVPEMDLAREGAAYQFSATDLLLLYLSVYPGRRIPGIAHLLQDPANERWAIAFEPRERLLALSLLSTPNPESTPGGENLTPSRFYREALKNCDGSPFCAALISHNVLRTLGRHEQGGDFNPSWFTEDPQFWITREPVIQSLMISLRADGTGDRWGEWYHFFGVLAFGLHELSLRNELKDAEVVVRLNEILNPILAGGAEGAEKARLDRDSLQVTWYFARWGQTQHEPLPSPDYCESRNAYVAFLKD